MSCFFFYSTFFAYCFKMQHVNLRIFKTSTMAHQTRPDVKIIVFVIRNGELAGSKDDAGVVWLPESELKFSETWACCAVRIAQDTLRMSSLNNIECCGIGNLYFPETHSHSIIIAMRGTAGQMDAENKYMTWINLSDSVANSSIKLLMKKGFSPFNDYFLPQKLTFSVENNPTLLDKSNFENLKVGVGVGVYIQSPRHGEEVVVGVRKSVYGHGQYALPGGHLENGESIEACAKREVEEECGVIIEDLHCCGVVNTVCCEDSYHYITIVMRGKIVEALGEENEPKNVEPHKCEGWNWLDLGSLLQMPQDKQFKALSTLLREGCMPNSDITIYECCGDE